MASLLKFYVINRYISVGFCIHIPPVIMSSYMFPFPQHNIAYGTVIIKERIKKFTAYFVFGRSRDRISIRTPPILTVVFRGFSQWVWNSWITD